jgi:hypothetical protein
MKQKDQQRRAQAGARWSVVERSADHLLRVQLPAALAGRAAPSSLPAGASDASAEAPGTTSGTWHSATARTCVSVRRWHGWRRRSPCAPCSGASPASRSRCRPRR